MNKLLLSLSLIFAATFAPAACYTWELKDGGNAKSSTDSYLLLGDSTVMFFTGTIGEINNGDGTYMLNFAAATYLAQSSSYDSYYRVGEPTFDADRTHDAVTGLADQSYSLLILDTGEDISYDDLANYNKTYALLTDTDIVNSDPDTSTPFSEFKYSAVVTSDMYHTAGVPEPTSGLLMLLGLSALALRRKRT